MRRIVIVGAAVAGLTAAETLRDEGFTGAITLVDGERHAAYDRPPLSKQVLSGRMQRSDLALKPADFCASHCIEHRLGVRAQRLDMQTRAVVLETGERLRFDELIIATGLRPKPLSDQPRLSGIHMLRTLDDAEALRADLLQARRVAVVGAGFLGSEIAATARELGAHATLVDALELPMLRQVGRDVASVILRTHRERGVHVRTGRVVAEFHHQHERVKSLTLDDGEHLDADVVVVAVGSIPNTEWLEDSGLTLDDGVLCDAYCRAADGVYAAGDVARWRHPRWGISLRLEHRVHAAEQAMVAARNLLGAAIPFDPLPYFWTDFHDVKVQVFGRIGMNDSMTVTSGDLAARTFTAVYEHGGVITAVLGWNAARAVRRMSALVGQSIDALQRHAALAA